MLVSMIMCNTRTKYWRRNYWTCLRVSYSCHNDKKQARLSTTAMAKLLDDEVMALAVITTKKKKLLASTTPYKRLES